MGISDIGKEVKNLIVGLKNAKLGRKSMIVKYCTCLIIIFVYVNWKYWDLMQYINLPMAPMFPTLINNINLIHLAIGWVVIRWLEKIVRETLIFPAEAKYEGQEILLKYFFAETIIDLILAIIALFGAINMLVEYVHGIFPDNMIVFWGASAFLIFSFLTKQYKLFTNDLRKMVR